MKVKFSFLLLILTFLLFTNDVSAIPVINFTYPTLNNDTTIASTSTEINISITEKDLEEFIWNWNGANYTFYNNSLVLMFNFNNVSALGENDTYVVDLSKYSNNGTVNGTSVMSLTGGKYYGAFNFNGDNSTIIVNNTNHLNITNNITISAWIKLDELDRPNTILSKESYSLKIKPDNSIDFGIVSDYNETNWTEVIYDNKGEEHIRGLAVSDDYLYAGSNPNGKIFRTLNGIDWTEIEDTPSNFINSFVKYNNYLYSGGSGKIYRSSDGID